MRRFLLTLALVLLGAEAFAAGSVTLTYGETRPTVRTVTLAWTSDAAGAVNGTLTKMVSGEVLRVVYVPGSGGTQPTDLYDLTLEDANGVDVLAGKGANLSNVNKTQICPLIGDGTTTNQRNAVDGTLELKVTNAGNAKTGTVVVYLKR